MAIFIAATPRAGEWSAPIARPQGSGGTELATIPQKTTESNRKRLVMPPRMPHLPGMTMPS